MTPYSIIATLGPASSTPEIWRGLVEAGATAFRLNTSHLSIDELNGWLDRLDGFQGGMVNPLPLILDLQASKWRVGDLPQLVLREGQVVRLVFSEKMGTAGEIPVPHQDFFKAASTSGGEITLNDARVRLRVLKAEADALEAVVAQGGELTARKGITYTDSSFRVEALSAKDQRIELITLGMPGVRYAISYVRDGTEMERYREISGETTDLIAKIERQPALEDALRIANRCNEIWLCRGDLGAELGFPEMARAVHNFSRLVPVLPVPCILAGQVLEHMTVSPNPTRAELCNLYDALQAGFAGVVLSDETAIGAYPIEACRAAAMFR